MRPEIVASEMFEECLLEGQSARAMADVAAAQRVREIIRSLAREKSIKIRTDYRDGVVMLVRLDAKLWQDSTNEMRRKLTPKQ